jgi:hypothetical protein
MVHSAVTLSDMRVFITGETIPSLQEHGCSSCGYVSGQENQVSISWVCLPFRGGFCNQEQPYRAVLRMSVQSRGASEQCFSENSVASIPDQIHMGGISTTENIPNDYK